MKRKPVSLAPDVSRDPQWFRRFLDLTVGPPFHALASEAEARAAWVNGWREEVIRIQLDSECNAGPAWAVDRFETDVNVLAWNEAARRMYAARRAAMRRCIGDEFEADPAYMAAMADLRTAALKVR